MALGPLGQAGSDLRALDGPYVTVASNETGAAGPPQPASATGEATICFVASSAPHQAEDQLAVLDAEDRVGTVISVLRDLYDSSRSKLGQLRTGGSHLAIQRNAQLRWGQRVHVDVTSAARNDLHPGVAKRAPSSTTTW